MSRIQAIICFVVLGLLAGCGATKQARDVDQSGFLGDIYPKLREGKEGEALLVYKRGVVNPQLNPSLSPWVGGRGDNVKLLAAPSP